MTVTTLILANGGEASLALNADAAAAALTASVYTDPNGANQGISSCSSTLVLKALVRAGTLCNQSKLQSAEAARYAFLIRLDSTFVDSALSSDALDWLTCCTRDLVSSIAGHVPLRRMAMWKLSPVSH